MIDWPLAYRELIRIGRLPDTDESASSGIHSHADYDEVRGGWKFAGVPCPPLSEWQAAYDAVAARMAAEAAKPENVAAEVIADRDQLLAALVEVVNGLLHANQLSPAAQWARDKLEAVQKQMKAAGVPTSLTRSDAQLL